MKGSLKISYVDSVESREAGVWGLWWERPDVVEEATPVWTPWGQSMSFTSPSKLRSGLFKRARYAVGAVRETKFCFIVTGDPEHTKILELWTFAADSLVSHFHISPFILIINSNSWFEYLSRLVLSRSAFYSCVRLASNNVQTLLDNHLQNFLFSNNFLWL